MKSLTYAASGFYLEIQGDLEKGTYRGEQDNSIIIQFPSGLQATLSKAVLWNTALICALWKIK